MKDLHNLLQKITTVTTNIETNYPELYRTLDENPMTIATSNHPHVDKMAMQEYLESLKDMLESYIKEENIKNNK